MDSVDLAQRNRKTETPLAPLCAAFVESRVLPCTFFFFFCVCMFVCFPLALSSR
jgi:hypothetical protein